MYFFSNYNDYVYKQSKKERDGIHVKGIQHEFIYKANYMAAFEKKKSKRTYN